ncbi:threonine synthase-like 1 [Liolophura sinensis]|uniref:threonine synthase-like 1 n=1 Tax=Liolophura sinensis TaxID=3198878 RepID=UPI0031598990
MTVCRYVTALWNNSPLLRHCFFGISKTHVFIHKPQRGFAAIVNDATISGFVPEQQSTGRGNIILMGCPGSGKTTIGSLLSKQLGMWQLDIDNDHLEPLWGTTVAQKLSIVGEESFIQEEGKAVEQLNVSNRVISLSGSNPLHTASMTQLRESGTVVYLDVPISDILCRLHKMKTDRIVGQGNGSTMKDVLQYRLQFYEKFYDIRVIVGKNETCESIAERVIDHLKTFREERCYLSTRVTSSANQEGVFKSFSDTIIQGFAQDGGLFVPAYDIPKFSLQEIERIVDLSYEERALRVLQRWIPSSQIDSESIRKFLSHAYGSGNFEDSNVCPVRHIHGNQYLSELYHGPTASFKDLSLQLMPQLFKHAVEKSPEHRNTRHLILVATSGDTGGAVLDGFSRLSEETDIAVMVLYPENGVSGIQKAQMTSMNGHRTISIGVNADFDFCQSTIKKIFRDVDLCKELKEKHNCYLSAANSINWGRLLPQIIHHCSAYLDLVKQGVVQLGEHVDCCVPTGNFGNILAAYYAKRLGMPFGRLICASNVNNVLSQFIKTGKYDLFSRKLHLSVSPAIDILKSSNLERYLWHISDRRGDIIRELYTSLESKDFFEINDQMRSTVQRDFLSDWCSEEECMDMIKETFTEHNYLLDPHTAVAKVVADRYLEIDRPMLIAATAHYGKFANEVLRALSMDNGRQHAPAGLFKILEELNTRPQMHKNLSQAVESNTSTQPVCEASLEDIVTCVKAFVASF